MVAHNFYSSLQSQMSEAYHILISLFCLIIYACALMRLDFTLYQSFEDYSSKATATMPQSLYNGW